MGDDVAHWAGTAEDWIRWARTPDHDAFWGYRAALADLVGPGNGRAALDLGAGEGRGSRLLSGLGWRVTAVEPVDALLAAAREAGSAERYVAAPASALPMPDGDFDLILAYNMLMDVDDLAGAVGEAARVLAQGGRLVVSVVHPLADLEAMPALAPPGYFADRPFDMRVEERGHRMHFAGRARSIETYSRALEAAGLGIARVREPRADATGPRAHLSRWARLPLFLWFEAVRL